MRAIKQGLEPDGGQDMGHWRGQRDCQITQAQGGKAFIGMASIKGLQIAALQHKSSKRSTEVSSE